MKMRFFVAVLVTFQTLWFPSSLSAMQEDISAHLQSQEPRKLRLKNALEQIGAVKYTRKSTKDSIKILIKIEPGQIFDIIKITISFILFGLLIYYILNRLNKPQIDIQKQTGLIKKNVHCCDRFIWSSRLVSLPPSIIHTS